MIKKLLIANRGEIALRIARTARALGIETVAVYSDADVHAPHAKLCDEAIRIGPAPASESYLQAHKIVAACETTGADAVHPGYGFLSENAGFADLLEEKNITFVGPTADTIRKMGSKSAAKDLMQDAGVPVTPGYQGDDQSIDTFRSEAEKIGYPVLLKATAGGGGKGMRRVDRHDELEDALNSARREAKAAFGDDRFLIEKYIPTARHLEVQIFGDGDGNVVHVFERDCSIQRRHQKVIEEAPAPNLSKATRNKLLQAGVDAAKAVNYRGAGTVEFLYDGKDAVYFMEMNTRLQVEHPVSEAISGLDFVEWQLRIAAGEPLLLSQDEIRSKGHSIEVRLYAEDPAKNFAPSVGTLTSFFIPDNCARIDCGVEENQEITPFYDPMIAKIIGSGETRSTALSRLTKTLEGVRVAGLETNAAFLTRILKSQAFQRGSVSTRFLDEHEQELFKANGKSNHALTAAISTVMGGAFSGLAGMRLNAPNRYFSWIEHEGVPSVVTVVRDDGSYHATIDPEASALARRSEQSQPSRIELEFQIIDYALPHVTIAIDGKAEKLFVAKHLNGLRIWAGAEFWDVQPLDPDQGISQSNVSAGSLIAPMPGLITAHSASIGDHVAAGEPLLIMEAMKMEHTLKAPYDGVIKSYKFSPGEQVKDGDLLVEFEEIAADT